MRFLWHEGLLNDRTKLVYTVETWQKKLMFNSGFTETRNKKSPVTVINIAQMNVGIMNKVIFIYLIKEMLPEKNVNQEGVSFNHRE